MIELTDVVELGNTGLFVKETWEIKTSNSNWMCWVTVGFILGAAIVFALTGSPDRLGP